jgi:hypothetical protein
LKNGKVTLVYLSCRDLVLLVYGSTYYQTATPLGEFGAPYLESKVGVACVFCFIFPLQIVFKGIEILFEKV